LARGVSTSAPCSLACWRMAPRPGQARGSGSGAVLLRPSMNWQRSSVGGDLVLSFTQARCPVAGAVSWPFSPLAGFTAPAGKTTAPAFSICLATESINSSQLLAKDAIPSSSSPLGCLRPLQCSLLPGSRSRTWRVLRCSFHAGHHHGFRRGRRRRAALLLAWC
jgi:hypothetical protein